MKCIFKKALSVLITLSLIFTLMPAAVFAAGDPPELQSAIVINANTVELTFDKNMADPASGAAGFAVYSWSGPTDKVVTAAQLDGTDSKKIRLALGTAVRGGENIYLMYTPGTVAAADGGVLAEKSYQTVSNTLPCPLLDLTPPPDGTKGIPYTHTFTLDTAGQPPYTFISGGSLPGGLTLNSSTGELSGTPGAAGTFNFAITVTDSVSAVNSRNFNLTVNAADVCQIDAKSYDTLDAALAAVQSGETIILLKSITHTDPIEVEGKTINFDLGDYDLLLDTSADDSFLPALRVAGGGKVNLTGAGTGEFNVKGSYGGVSIIGANSEATVHNVEVTENDNGVSMVGSGQALDGGTITVKGNIKAERGSGVSVNAKNGKVVVNGSITAGRVGVATATNPGTQVTVNGDITIIDKTPENQYDTIGIQANGGTIITVTGNVTVQGTNCIGVYAYGGKINVGGNVASAGKGAKAEPNYSYGDGEVTITGSLSAGTTFITVGTTELTASQGSNGPSGSLIYTDGKSVVQIGRVGDSAPAPTVESVTVTPATASVQKGTTRSFSATVNGTNNPAQAVTWSVSGANKTGTTISAAGVLTIAADETAATLTVTATSTANTAKSGTATITVAAAAVGSLDTWARRTVINQNYTNQAIAYGNGVFVTVGDGVGGSQGRILTSNDGAAWTSRNSPTTNPLYSVVYGNSTFVAVGAGTVLTSPEGETWTVRSVPVPGDIYGVSYGNGTFVAVGIAGRIWTSQDGENWSKIIVYGPNQAPLQYNDFKGICYANGTFVAVGTGGTIITSGNGTDWTVRSQERNPVNANFYGVCCGSNLFIAVGEFGKIFTSQDNGATWVPQTSGTSSDLHGVTYGNGTFLAVGKKGTILSSSDGSTWTARDSGLPASEFGLFGNNLYGACSANDSFLAVGANNIIIQSGGAASDTVSSVTVTPATASVQKGNTQSFSATVNGTNSPAQTVTWSVNGNNSSGTSINSSGLLTVAANETSATLTVAATSTADSSKSGTATVTVTAVAVTTYTVTFNSNGSVYAVKTVNAGESIGSAAWPADPTRSSYIFGGWFTGANGSGRQFTSATPVNATIIVYAKWTYSGGSGGGGGTPSTPLTPETPNYKANVKTGNNAETTIPVVVDKNAGTASVDAGPQNLAQGGTVIKVPSIPDVDTYSVGIPVPDLSTTAVQGTLTLDTVTGSVTVPSNMLSGVSGISGSKAKISIGQGDKSTLPKGVQAAIGDKPLIQLTLSIDGKRTDWSNPKAPVAVSIPYTPAAAELTNHESIVVWYIDGSGNVVTIPNGHYDPRTGMVTFSTTHFGDYAVVYNKASFNDVPASAWYKKAVSFIAARKITSGTGNGNYSPDAKLTRGEFIVLMMRAYGISPDANPTNNFTDAGSTYYTGYLAAAKRLGITSGVGNNMYAPGNQITRQEMFTLLYNALKVIGQLPGTHGRAVSEADEQPQRDSGKKVLDFSDATQISDWAREAMKTFVVAGTVGGSNGKLTPTDTTTRAEMAQVLYNLLGK